MLKPMKKLTGTDIELMVMKHFASTDPDFAPFYYRLAAHAVLALHVGAGRLVHKPNARRIMIWRCYLDGDVKAMRQYLAQVAQAGTLQKAIDAVLKSPVRRTTEMRLSG